MEAAFCSRDSAAEATLAAEFQNRAGFNSMGKETASVVL